MRSLFFPVVLLSLLGGCASHTPAPVATPFPLQSQQDGLAEPASAPVATAPITIVPPSTPPSVVPPKKATLPPAQLLDKLLPDYVKPRSGWRDDIVNAIGALQAEAEKMRTDLEEKNRLGADPDNIGFSKQIGDARVKGVELEGQFQFANDLTVTAAYARNEAEVSRSNFVSIVITTDWR